MKSNPLICAGALALCTVTAFAEDNALIDILVRKGVLSTKEAVEVRRELKEENASIPANRIKISDSTSELRIYGDIRLRYQYDTKDSQQDSFGTGVNFPLEQRSSTGSQRSRLRFRLRLNADFKLGEHWFGGAELQTNNASDSANQTFENGFSDYNIFISRAYLGWKNEWLTATAGKVPNPFYSTELVWDPDINPTGFTQSVKLDKLFGGEQESSYSKDGKASKPAASPWEWTLNLAEFIFDDNQESAFDNDASSDPWIFEAQIVGSYKFANGIKAVFAPGYMVYTPGDVSDANNENPFSDAPFVSGETRNLSIIMFPGEIGFQLFGIPSKLYWDAAYNIEGRKRAENIYSLAFNDLAGRKHSQYTTADSFAYLAGIQVGENRKQGDWAVLANWRQTGIASVDPNLNESDFASGELNTRGIQLRASYNFTNFAVGSITYAHAWNFKDNLAGGQATYGAALADENSFDLIQVDLNVKF